MCFIRFIQFLTGPNMKMSLGGCLDAAAALADVQKLNKNRGASGEEVGETLSGRKRLQKKELLFQ